MAQERVALSLGKRYGVPTVAMRYSIVQGPRQSFYNAYSGACRLFCLSFHLGRVPMIYEDGRQVRDFVNIHDVVDANLLVLHDDRAIYETFNVGGDKPYTVGEFASAVANAYGVTSYEPSPCGKFRFGDTRHICSDVTKLKRLGWKPARSIHDSIEAYKGWLTTANNAAEILDYCNLQMAKQNVVREVARA
jgi:dTDP-L-rhamnose 4-epimerase